MVGTVPPFMICFCAINRISRFGNLLTNSETLRTMEDLPGRAKLHHMPCTR